MYWKESQNKLNRNILEAKGLFRECRIPVILLLCHKKSVNLIGTPCIPEKYVTGTVSSYRICAPYTLPICRSLIQYDVFRYNSELLAEWKPPSLYLK